MSYENDPYLDEDGEPLMDYDDGFQSDHGDDNNNQDQHLLDDNLEDELEDNDWQSNRRARSPTPVFNDSDSKSRPRKRLIKKSTAEESVPDFGMDDDVEDVVAAFVRDDSDSGGGKRKKFSGDSGSGKKREKKFSSSKFSDRGGRSSDKGGSKFKGNGKRSGHSGRVDAEVKEMWETVAGGDSEDDKEGTRMVDDDNFIDDTGVDPSDRYGSDQGGYSPSHAPQAEEGEEDDEIKDLFKMGKKKKKSEKSAAEIALLVENVMAELEVVAEEDAELNRKSEPAINKLRKLPLLIEVLSKKQLQLEFLDHGVLTLLKNWLEPLPDGSLPNINIRAAILKILTEFPIDLDQYDRREQLKKSGLGKVVIMFLSKSDEETTSNRKLAKDLVDKWSRPIFNKSTRFEDMRNYEDDRIPMRRPSMKKPMNKASGMQSRDDDLDLADNTQEPKSGSSSSRLHTTRPEAMPLDFVVRPQSKIDPDEIRARAKQVVHDQRRLKMNKRLQQLKAPKKKQLQATKLSVEGRVWWPFGYFHGSAFPIDYEKVYFVDSAVCSKCIVSCVATIDRLQAGLFFMVDFAAETFAIFTPIKQKLSMTALMSSDPMHFGMYEGGSFRHSDDTLEENGGRWYFSRKEIEENSPSRPDGIDLKKETYLRKSYCTFLQDLGMRLKVPQVTIATAIIFCHRFFLRQSHAKNDRRTIATVCMFLAGKVEETPRPLKDVILVSYEINNKKDPEAIQRIKQKEVYEQQKELILLGERVVLATLGFDFNVHHPYKPLVEAIKKFKVAQNALAQVAWNFVNDGLRTSLCLQFKPHHIAAGAIFLAAKFLKVKLPSDGEKVWWQEFDVTPRQLEEVSNQMLELYEQNRVAPPQTSEVVDGSTGGGVSQKGPTRSIPVDEDGPHNSNSRPGTSSRPPPDQPGQNMKGGVEINESQQHYGPEDGNGSDGHNEETRERRELVESAKGRNVDYKGQSPQDAIKRIDKDKVKAALEKRKKARGGDVTRKADILDEDDIIEREIEDGIELPAESEKNKQDRKHNWSKSSNQMDNDLEDGQYHSYMKGHSSCTQDFDPVEEGEVGMMDDEYRSRSPKFSNRKRKGGGTSPDKRRRN
ncbi:hypothetical protein E3N88_17281 [Mikania micrantha]|uniref:TFIIS N-terminal domain-containing protein n=1 Tax=Mikania micrantha TaxID=192012 RepID=A0A5N6NTN4_9ASTR|nr:hypothetical protein E3N88_17281 [Mikania micrantha]